MITYALVVAGSILGTGAVVAEHLSHEQCTEMFLASKLDSGASGCYVEATAVPKPPPVKTESAPK